VVVTHSRIALRSIRATCSALAKRAAASDLQTFASNPRNSMPLSMHQASVPLFVRALGNLSAILEKGAAHPDGDALVEARLAPDMLTLAGQIQRASDTAKGCAARLAGIEPPSFPDDEKTFAQLQARIAKTLDFLRSVKPEQIDGSEDKPVTLKAGPRELKFTGASYLLTFAIPNFYFHVTTAYAILRHKGVPIGKMDYIGGV
jgi:hypothetical protein